MNVTVTTCPIEDDHELHTSGLCSIVIVCSMPKTRSFRSILYSTALRLSSRWAAAGVYGRSVNPGEVATDDERFSARAGSRGTGISIVRMPLPRDERKIVI